MDPHDGLFIGLISGTSIDGVDAALVRFRGRTPELLSARFTPWPQSLQERLRDLCHPGPDEIERLGLADALAGDLFADCALALLAQAGVAPSEVSALGSHGQTVRHRPWGATPFTLQIGDPNRIAEKTGITTVADFRRRDMAAGGEGAPLVPAFHADWLRHPDEFRAVLNIGGIANLTLIPPEPDRPVRGFDTGPGNTLLDAMARRHLGVACDEGGAWAAGGSVIPALLECLLRDPYFIRRPPKSTGPEYFNLNWLAEQHDSLAALAPKDIQATLIALAVRSIIQAIRDEAPECARVIACGGGVHNRTFMGELGRALGKIELCTTADFGIDPDQVEAVAFAWLARRTLLGLSGNLPAVTGARREVVLGGIYPP